MMDNFTYAKTGVDINLTDATKRNMAKVIDRGDKRVLNRLGAFASLVEGRFDNYKHPILVLKTEEPGSKQKLAFQHGFFSSISYDLVNHLINDVIVMGAEPLYVQDCIVCGTINPEIVQALVSGIADACRAQDCVLTGGETSVQPGIVADGVYILSASAIGVVDKENIIDGSAITEGDVVLAVASNGLHTNGYTLVRTLLENDPNLKYLMIGDESFLDVIMRSHYCYFQSVRGLFPHQGLKGLAHITGGGIQDNLNRIHPLSLVASIDLSRLKIPDVFKIIRDQGNVPDSDMLRTFNMGVGLILVCTPEAVNEIISHLSRKKCESYVIGKIIEGAKTVKYHNELMW